MLYDNPIFIVFVQASVFFLFLRWQPCECDMCLAGVDEQFVLLGPCVYCLQVWFECFFCCCDVWVCRGYGDIVGVDGCADVGVCGFGYVFEVNVDYRG